MGGEEEVSDSVWEGVVELTKWAQSNNTDPLLWSVQVSSTLTSAGVTLPSRELSRRLVSHICWDNHVPMTWKYLDTAISLNILPPFLVLSLLSTRVLPKRHLHPASFTLFLSLLKRHAVSSLSSSSNLNSPNYPLIMRSVDHSLHLSQLYNVNHSDPQPQPGVVMVWFLFTILCRLVEATLDDEGLLEHKPTWHQDDDGDDVTMVEANNEGLLRKNTGMAIELIALFLQNKVTSRILSLLHTNMYVSFQTTFLLLLVFKFYTLCVGN